MGELGELLRKTRESKGLSVADVEESTRIRSSFLQALEEEAWDRLPPTAYVKGFLKNYAGFLGLGVPQVLALYQGPAANSSAEFISMSVDQPLVPYDVRRFWPIVALVLVVALAAAGWLKFGVYVSANLPGIAGRLAPSPTPTDMPTATPTTPAPTATPTPTELPTATPTSTPATALELSIEVVGEPAWVSVQVDGQRAFADTLAPGSLHIWTARERIVLRCGNAGAVRVNLNGQALGLFGENGQVVEREWTAPGVPTRTPVLTASRAP